MSHPGGSAASGRPMTPLRSVQDAIVRLGVNCVRNLVASAISMAHAACGALALHVWKLPDEVLAVVRHHHDYTLAVDTRATAVCYAANRLSHRYGFGCPAEDDAVLDDPVWSALALDASWIEALDQRAPGLVHAARQALA